jgi:hypothetical protein
MTKKNEVGSVILGYTMRHKTSYMSGDVTNLLQASRNSHLQHLVTLSKAKGEALHDPYFLYGICFSRMQARHPRECLVLLHDITLMGIHPLMI